MKAKSVLKKTFVGINKCMWHLKKIYIENNLSAHFEL